MTDHDFDVLIQEIDDAFGVLWATAQGLTGAGIDTANVITAAVQVIRMMADELADPAVISEAVDALLL